MRLSGLPSGPRHPSYSSSPNDEQQPDPALEPGVPEATAPVPEPRLLTRPERQGTGTPSRNRHRQVSPERGLGPWAKRLAARRGRAKTPRITRRWWAGVLLALALLAVAALLGGTLYLRHAALAALPTLDGREHVAGLRGPVEVTRDAQGVPTLSATSLPDLLFAQGYITAGDRLWQMDALRRHAAGELAEILGPAMVEHDRRQRYLQIRAAADRAVAVLPTDQLAELQAYAGGVNAYIEAHGDALPLEFKLLAYRPAPWTPRDSLLVSLAMWQDLSTEFPRKMDRDALSAHLPPELLADLYPVGSWRDGPPAAQGRDLTAPHNVEQIPLDPSQSRLGPAPAPSRATPASLLAMTEALVGGDRCEGCRSGSNNWAVSGAHTASGAPLVSNDMHLSLAIPDIWYEASLHADLTGTPGRTGRLDVTGFTLPGVPFVIVGRNARVGWGVTNLGADVQDLRIEHLRGAGDNTEYQRPDGTWAAILHRTEAIRVRGGRTVTLEVQLTDHANGAGSMDTPLVSPLYPGETRALSLAWTAYDPTAVSSPFLGVDLAQDGPSLVAALAHFGGPSLNLVWADAAGHIGYHAIGWIPVRGPAVQHPRAVQAPASQPGPAPPDEGAEQPEGPEARLQGQPRLTLSAFHPVRRGRLPSPRAVGNRRTTLPGTGRPRGPRAPRATKAAAPAAVPEEMLPAVPVVDYTVGSPISPLPVDALDGAQAWSEYIPYDALPAVVDPKNGFLATANARVTPDDSPYMLTNDWADPFRVERLIHLLAGRGGLKPADMLRFETDVHSDVNMVLAHRLAYAVDHTDAGTLGASAARLHSAADLLRDWDGEMRADSAPAAMVAAVRRALWPALLVPPIAAHDGVDPRAALALTELYTWGEKTTALEWIVQHEPARWLPKGVASWNDFLASTLAQALGESDAPGNLGHWQYGDRHTVEIAHPLFGAHPLLSRLLGVRATTGARPAPGDATTIDALGAHFGPSERFTADLSSPEAALGNITTGESANPRSPWYLDQFPAWLAGRSFDLPGAGSAATHSLTLAP